MTRTRNLSDLLDANGDVKTASLDNVAAAGALMTSGGTVTGDINFGDNDKAIFGAGSDLQIYHASDNHSNIRETGSGNLQLWGSNTNFLNTAGSKYHATFADGGAVTLYHNGNAKLATTSSGVDVTGVITTDGMTTSADINFGDNDKAIFGAGNDLQIYHDGSASRIVDAGTGGLTLQADANVVIQNSAGTETKAEFTTDGAVNLYHDNAKKFETTSSGISVTGATTVTKGSAGTLATFTDGVNSNFVIETASLITTVGNTGGSTALAFKSANTQRMLLHSSGSLLVGKTAADSIPTDGIEIDGPNGRVIITRDGSEPLILNRKTSDGIIVGLRKDGTTVGVIGTQNWGIGTASPAHNLEIVATNAGSVNDSLQIRNNATSSGTGSRIRFINSTDANSDTNGASISSVRNGNDNDLVFETENAERMRIDASGRVTMPYHPVFSAYRAGTNVPDSTVIVWTNTTANVGSHYNTSNGRFTAPVTGNYFFSAFAMSPSTTGGFGIRLRLNGTPSGTTWAYVNSSTIYQYKTVTMSFVIGLNATDYIEIMTQGGTMHSTANYHNNFCGYLVG